MSMQKKLGPALSIVFGGIAAVSIAPARAQEVELAELETVVVTGSLLKRLDSEVALPVTVLSADDVIKAGATNAIEVLQLVGQNQSNATSTAATAGDGSGFATYANLRSLGSQRTLILVNGKRMVNYPYQSLGVDLNTVPMVLIERVDVLSDGASSTYGSDAIAGVVNYITRRELTGLTMSASTLQPEASGGGQTYQGNAGVGYGTLGENGWNAEVGGFWRKFEPLINADREFADSGFIPERGVNRLSGTTFPANYSQQVSGVTAVNPMFPQCNPPNSLRGDGSFGPSSCAFDGTADLEAIPGQEQWSAIGKGTVELGDHNASLEYIRAHSEVNSGLSWTQLFGLTMQSSNPFYPGQGITPGVAGLNPALPVSMNWRLTAVDRGTIDVLSSTERFLAQLDGQVLRWDYQLFGLKSNATVTTEIGGFPVIQRIRDGLAGANGAPFLNPFGSQSAAGQQFLLDNRVYGETQRAEGELTMLGVQFSRAVGQLPAGPLALAFAAEYKEEDSQFRNNFGLIRSTFGTGFDFAQDVAGDRESSGVVMELSVPVVQDLELNSSVRYDHYSDFGDTVNPKVSVRYQPVDALMLRASYNTGFRAATLYDLYGPETLTISRSRAFDPVLCPGGVPSLAAGAVQTRDCNVQFNLRPAGNPDLDAEESTAYSVGFLVQPFARMSFGVDYWDYEVTQSIGVLADTAVFGDPVKYADKIVRCSQVTAAQRAVVPACNIPGGDPIAYIDSRTQNLGDTRTSGFDITAQWSTRDTRFGTFGLNYRGTYVEKYEFQREPGGEFFSRNGEFIDRLPIIRYSHYTTLNWNSGSWSARLVNRYKSGYTDCNQPCVGNRPQFFRKVDPYSLWDLSATFTGGSGLSITAAVNNVLDEDPPFTNKTNGNGTGYDERFADPLGRTYMLLFTYEYEL